jgi:hypothetical protein
MYLTFQSTTTATATATKILDLDEMKLSKIIQDHFEMYIRSDAMEKDYFLLDSAFIVQQIQSRRQSQSQSQPQPQPQVRRRPRRQQQQQDDTNNNEYTIGVYSSATFEQSQSPINQEEMNQIQQLIFNKAVFMPLLNQNLNQITKESVMIADVTFKDDNNNGLTTPPVDIIGGNNGSTGGIVGGVVGALVVFCVASFMFIKYRKNQDVKQKTNNGIHHDTTSTSTTKKKKVVTSVYTNDDGDIFEMVYKKSEKAAADRDTDGDAHVGLQQHQKEVSLSPSLKQYFSSSSTTRDATAATAAAARSTATTTAIPLQTRNYSSLSQSSLHSNQYNNNNNNKDNDDNHDDTDDYSIDGSIAIDTSKPNVGEVMLKHVLSMNNYSNDIYDDDDDDEEDNLSDFMYASDSNLSMYSHSNEAKSSPSLLSHPQENATMVEAASTSAIESSLHKAFSDDKVAVMLKSNNNNNDDIQKSHRHQEQCNQSLMDDCHSSDQSDDSISAVSDIDVSALIDEAEVEAVAVQNDNDDTPETKGKLTFSREQKMTQHQLNFSEYEDDDDDDDDDAKTEFVDNSSFARKHQIIETEQATAVKSTASIFNLQSTSNTRQMHQHKITVVTSDPHHPHQIPKRYPIQAARERSDDRKFIHAFDGYSSGDENDDNCFSEVVEEVDRKPLNNAKTIVVPNHYKTTARSVLGDYNYIPSSSAHQTNNMQKYYSKTATAARNANVQNPTFDAASARNARKNRLAKFIETPQNNYETNINSKAELVAGLRRSRLQQQQQQKSKPLATESGRHLRKSRLS